MGLFNKRVRQAGKPDMDRLPRHIAIIMDGNGRWARKRGMPRTSGHAAGAETFRRIATYCRDIGVKYLTVYAFSTENWKRPEEEVNAIMSLLETYLEESIEKMAAENIKLKIFGDTDRLSPKIRELIAKTDEISSGLDGVQANLCINYGGRDEIVRAAQRFAEEYRDGEVGELTEVSFGGYLYSAGIPDPDLVIRPSGEVRISNFLLWQTAYSEFYFTDVLWPDFDEQELLRAIASYQSRDRRFGGIRT